MFSPRVAHLGDIAGDLIRMTLKEEAIRLANEGFEVFPLSPGTAKPLKGSRGFHDATSDPAKVAEIWGRNPDCNIGLRPPRGVLILDPDSKDGKKSGLKSLADLEANDPIERILEAKTPSGGRHIWMAIAPDAPSPPSPGKDIDVRTHDTGYVVVAPSIVGGRGYEWTAGKPTSKTLKKLPTAPLWASAPRPERPKDETDSGVMFRALVQAALNGARTASEARDWCEAAGLLEDVDVSKWDRARTQGTQIDKDWASALVHATAQKGKAGKGESPNAKPTLRLIETAERRSFKPPCEIIEGLFRERELSLLIGQSGAGKTFFGLAAADAVAAGSPFMGRRVRQTGVIYVALEAELGVMARLRALEMERGRASAVSLMTGALDLRASAVTRRYLVDTAKRQGAGLIIIDTLARSLAGADENSAADMGEAIAAAKEVQDASGAHVCLVHHLGKDAARGARGSSALKAAADLEITVEAEGEERVARVSKAKDDAGDATMSFTIKTVETDLINSWGERLRAGVLLPSGAIEFEPVADPDGEALEVLRTLTALSDLLDPPTIASWQAALKGRGWRAESTRWRKHFHETKCRLVDSGKITVEGDNVNLTSLL